MMSHVRCFPWMVMLALGMSAPAWAGQIDGGLQGVLDETPEHVSVSTLVFLLDRVDLVALTAELDQSGADRQRRHKVVVEALQDKANETQIDLLLYLTAEEEVGRIDSFKPFWIINAIRVDAIPEQIIAIAARDDVDTVFFDVPVELIKPVDYDLPAEAVPADGGRAGASMDPTSGIKIIKADRVWNELGITGRGVLVANLDTGVDGNHPALKDRWRGLDERYKDNPEWAFLDPYTQRKFPFDFGSHGTHTMGTITGGHPGEQIGVAPGAEWIASAALGQQNRPKYVESLQWMADPDGDPDTVWDVPDVCSNSWGVASGHPPCDKMFWGAIDASEAAGVVQVFAAGNEGVRGLRRPGDRATTDYNSYAVAACDGNNPECPLASFSSQGPTNCTENGEEAIKPEITGPGVNVRSAVPGGGYRNNSGTSMSTPHIAGVVGLMRSANPKLGVEEIKQIIFDTATDKGEKGNDNKFGHGLINALDAVIAGMGSKDPAACCFGKGGCRDLKSNKCRKKGGRFNFGETCGDFDCPQPGACCIDNSTCEVMLERACRAQGGDFKGEGESCKLACPCDLIKRFKASCGKSGTIKAQVKFKDKRRDGETITIKVGDRTKFEVTIRGKKARLFTCCWDGEVELSLIDPEGCRDPITVNCK